MPVLEEEEQPLTVLAPTNQGVAIELLGDVEEVRPYAWAAGVRLLTRPCLGRVRAATQTLLCLGWLCLQHSP